MRRWVIAAGLVAIAAVLLLPPASTCPGWRLPSPVGRGRSSATTSASGSSPWTGSGSGRPAPLNWRETEVSAKISVFRSPEGEAQYNAAYEASLKQWPVPYDELYVPTRFGETHTIASGSMDAPPLLLFNPTGSSSTIWCRNVEPLSRHFRTYAVDMIGEPNKSVVVRPVKGRQGLVDWVLDLFNGLQIERAHLAGNSFGGFMALNTALTLPERVMKVVLISPAATFVQIWPWYWHFVLPAKVIAPVIGSKGLADKAYDWMWQGLPKDEWITPLRATISMVGGTPRHPGPSVFSDEELRRVRTPVLLLIGDREVIYSAERVVRRATRLVPGLKAEIIPNANHNAQFTAAAAVNDKILGFLLEG